jgi:uncharacterized membrane protein
MGKFFSSLPMQNALNVFYIALTTFFGFGVVVPGIFSMEWDVGPIFALVFVVIFFLIIWNRCEAILKDNRKKGQ